MKTFFILLLLLSSIAIVQAQPGTLDKTFGEQGIVYTNVFGVCSASALQPDGKIIAAGSGTLGGIIIRYLPDGSLDSSFGKNGITILSSVAEIDGVALQPDGKIIASGLNAQLSTFAIRLKEDGHLDSSFGENGITKLEFGDYQTVNAISIQSDGKILINGFATDDNVTLEHQYMVVIRLTVDGSIDKSFGGGGRVLNYTGVNSSSLAVQTDDKIVTCGYNLFGRNGQDFVTSRYTKDGSLDKTFGDNGNIITDGRGCNDNPNAIAVQKDGKIVVVGFATDIKTKPTSGYMTALRYEASGSIDYTFGTDGKAFVSFGAKASGANAVLFQQDGKIIMAGGVYADIFFSTADYALCRLNTNGSIDSTFGESGRRITELGGYAYCRSAVLQKDGKIVLVGEEEVNYNYLLTRYNGDDNTKQPLLVRIKRWLQHHGISWQLGNNIRYYAVQRSTDGIVYKEIARLGNSSNSYEDATQLSGSNYYRLAATAKDGSRIYSNTVLIDEFSQVQLFPNPVTNNLHLQGLPSAGKTIISVVDLKGQLKSIITLNSSNCIINTSKLVSGNYLLQIKHNSTSTTMPFVKE